MPPEERFQKIENLLHAMTERQAYHEEALARHDEAVARNDAQIEKQNAGIQDLIRVSRALIDSQTQAWDAIRAVSERVDRLTEDVNRFLKGLQKPNGNH